MLEVEVSGNFLACATGERRHANSGVHTLEDAEELQLVVNILFLLLQVNRACALLVRYCVTQCV